MSDNEVFVDNARGDDGFVGTRERPARTISGAIEIAKRRTEMDRRVRIGQWTIPPSFYGPGGAIWKLGAVNLGLPLLHHLAALTRRRP